MMKSFLLLALIVGSTSALADCKVMLNEEPLFWGDSRLNYEEFVAELSEELALKNITIVESSPYKLSIHLGRSKRSVKSYYSAFSIGGHVSENGGWKELNIVVSDWFSGENVSHAKRAQKALAAGREQFLNALPANTECP